MLSYFPGIPYVYSMFRNICLALTVSCFYLSAAAQHQHASSAMKKSNAKEPITLPHAAHHWVDSVFNTLSDEEKITQLIFIRAFANSNPENIDKVTRLVKTKGVGGLVFFQGGPVRQAELTNYYQSISRVPLFVSMDGEWGLGMRLDSVIPFPRQLTLGAIGDSTLIYDMGKAIGAQCKRLGVQINFAPDVDINNNPDNPVIGDRSYGENKKRVADFGIQYMRGMQSEGIIACAKHFPGHGDTNVDSHKDLPEINKTMRQLESLELYPFERMIHAGVKSIMVAHLYIPAIDKTPHLPTSLSHKNVTGLLRHQLGFKGLIFTDALEMKGVTKYFSDGNASMRALMAGNDILLLPEDVDAAVNKIKWAIGKHLVDWASINERVKKVLTAKYEAGLNQWQSVDTANLVNDLNAHTLALKKKIAEKAITVLSNENFMLPFRAQDKDKIAYLGVGILEAGSFTRALKGYKAGVDDYYFPADGSYEKAAAIAGMLKGNYDKVIIGLSNFSHYPANNFGLTNPEIQLVQQLEEEMRSVTVVFGNPYALKNFSPSPNLIAAYEDDSIMHQVAADLIFQKIMPAGKLPVTVSPDFKYGAGLSGFESPEASLPTVAPEKVGMNSHTLEKIDSIAKDAIAKGAAPGCVVLAMRNGKIFYQKAFGHLNYEDQVPVTTHTVYDLASVTKICATTVSCMRMYDEGKLKLDKTLGNYLPWLRHSDKAPLKIKDIMTHQAGLVAWIPFYKYTLYDGVHPDTGIYNRIRNGEHTVRVAENMYMEKDYLDTMEEEIRNSKLGPLKKYVYSDNDFILMGRIVEQLTGQTLDQYAKRIFYDRLGMLSTGFKPRERYSLNRIAPTECEKYFRLQCLQGDVHDPGAAMFGGVSGHAGLFSDAYDLGVLMQMVLNGGSFNGVRYIKPSTIKLFTAYNTPISRRGLGFDKPEKDRKNEKDPYPCKSASPETFGHTGFTGTCVWVDPKYKLIYIFLSNRVCPDGGANLNLEHMEVRSKIQETLYEAMGVGK